MATVTVGCKLPHGLIIDVEGKKVKLNGANTSLVIGGYGLTPVEKDFFDAWLKLSANTVVVKRGLIFAQETQTKARDQAKEQAEVKSGLEGLNPEKPAPGIKPEKYEGKKEDKA
jgi:hypothetical protein